MQTWLKFQLDVTFVWSYPLFFNIQNHAHQTCQWAYCIILRWKENASRICDLQWVDCRPDGRWMNSIIGGKITDRTHNEILKESVFQCHSAHHESYINCWDRTRAFGGEKPATSSPRRGKTRLEAASSEAHCPKYRRSIVVRVGWRP